LETREAAGWVGLVVGEYKRKEKETRMKKVKYNGNMVIEMQGGLFAEKKKSHPLVILLLGIRTQMSDAKKKTLPKPIIFEL